MDSANKAIKVRRPPTNFSHDIRTPLAIMRLNVDLIKEGGEFDNIPKMRRFVKAIDREIEKVIKILSDYKC